MQSIRSWTQQRELTVYPSTPARVGQFGLITLVSTVIFYQIYVQGAVSPLIIADFSIPLKTFVLVSIVGNAVGAVAAWAAGLADRVGRVNLILVGSAGASAITGIALPATTGATAYLCVYASLSLIGGVVLVATSALIRDFSPQLGRATAMGLWAVGPSLGNLLISAVTHQMLPTHPDWQYHFQVAGLIGMLMFLLAAGYLRELSPQLRDQVMVSLRDQVLIESRVRQAETDDGASTPRSGINTMWRPALVVPALGISLFLMFYVTRVGFFVLYFVSNFGYTTSRANGLATWYWVANVIALVGVGLVSDRWKVRKPLMVVGAVASAAALAVFASRADDPTTSYGGFVVLLVVLAAAGGMVSTTWLAMFTETVEGIDPTAIARGMAVYGSVLRAFVVVTLIGFMTTVSAASVLVDQGARVSSIATTYGAELQTLGTVAPGTMSRLRADPGDARATRAAVKQLRAAKVDRPRDAIKAALAVPANDLTYLSEHVAGVKEAAADGPGQWKRWWWVCLVGQLLIIPLSLGMRGRWNPRTAAADAARHQVLVDAETARLRKH
ncbi:MAG: transporter [Marmoricola sp.]|nr:transporter [Marmoricola sp.]